MSATEIHVALGANLPPSQGEITDSLHEALDNFSSKNIHISRVSRFFSTPCFPPGAGPDYVNACVTCFSENSPAETMRKLHEIEQELGRERKQRWGSRVLDLDLLAFGDSVLPDSAEFARWHDLPAAEQSSVTPPELILPHPRIQDRAFVLVPWRDIAPNWRHPVLGLSVAQMLARLPSEETRQIIPI